MTGIHHHQDEDDCLDRPAPPMTGAALPPEPTRPALVDPAPMTAAEVIAAHLEAVLSGNRPVEAAIHALRVTIDIAADPQLVAAPAELLHLEDMLQRAAPRVAEAVAHHLPAEAVHLGFAAASGLLRNRRMPADCREGRALVLARVDHAALLAAELEVIVHRRRIEADGDQLRRAYRLACARDAVRDDALLQ